jgi:hypothetical protein
MPARQATEAVVASVSAELLRSAEAMSHELGYRATGAP